MKLTHRSEKPKSFIGISGGHRIFKVLVGTVNTCKYFSSIYILLYNMPIQVNKRIQNCHQHGDYILG